MSSSHIVSGSVTTNVGLSVLSYSGVDVCVGIAGNWSENGPSLDLFGRLNNFTE